MPLTYEPGKFDEYRRRISSIFEEIEPDLEMVGKLAAEAIVRTTLAGIGEDDAAFAPYSQAYQALIESVGGKPQQTVNLRGLFYHKGQKHVKFRSEKRRQQFRADRQAFINLRFVLAKRAQRAGRGYRGAGRRSLASLLRQATGLPGKAPKAPKAIAFFTARTAVTRPARGVTDPLSEMSLDLITVRVGGQTLKIIYKPRQKAYMITHNEGDARMPRRRWFTLNKAAVKAAIIKGFEIILRARMLRAQLNEVGGGGPVAPLAEPVAREVLGLPGDGV